MEFIEMATKLIIMNAENELKSIVKGNCNWIIRTETFNNGKIARIGRACRMKRYCSYWLKDAIKYNYRTYNFTYKKDFENAVQSLEKENYIIIWAN